MPSEIDESQSQKFQRRKNQKSFGLGNWIVIGSFLLPVLCVILFLVYQAGIAQSFWDDFERFCDRAVGPMGSVLATLVKEVLPYILVWGPLSAGVWIDARNRRMNPWAWSIFVFLMGVIGFPFYFAKRPLKEDEVREGGFMFNVLKGFVLVWTLTNILGFGVGFFSSRAIRQSLTFSAIVFTCVWILPMVGAALLGWFVRNPAIVERGPTGPLAASSNRPAR